MCLHSVLHSWVLPVCTNISKLYFQFGIVEKNFLSISCLCSCFFCSLPKFFLLFFLCIFILLRTHFFNTKYFVLPYSIDVISTLSCCDRQFVILKYSTNLTKPQESCISPGTRPPTHPVGLRVEAAMVSADINAELVCPLSAPSFPPGTHGYGTKRHNPIKANMRSPDKKPRLSSVSIAKLKNHTMKSTLMAPKWTAEWGQRQSSTANSRMVRQPAATCPKAYQGPISI